MNRQNTNTVRALLTLSSMIFLAACAGSSDDSALSVQDELDTTVSFAADAVAENAELVWRQRSVGTEGASNWSAWRALENDSDTEQASATDEATVAGALDDGAVRSERGELSWSGAADALAYEVQIFDQTSSRVLAVDQFAAEDICRADGCALVVEADNADAAEGSNNLPPIASFEFSHDAEGDLPMSIVFDGSASYDPEGGDLRYKWTVLGELVRDNRDKLFSHRFDEPGEYQVQLRISDDRGQRAVERHNITLQPSAASQLVPIAGNTEAGENTTADAAAIAAVVETVSANANELPIIGTTSTTGSATSSVVTAIPVEAVTTTQAATIVTSIDAVEPVSAPDAEVSAIESSTTPIVEAESQATIQPVVEVTQEVAVEPVAEVTPEAVVESVVEVAPEPVVESVVEVTPEPAVEVEAGPTPSTGDTNTAQEPVVQAAQPDNGVDYVVEDRLQMLEEVAVLWEDYEAVRTRPNECR